MDASARPDPESLLAQADWLRALARRLAADGHAAEDLEQETWLAALRAPLGEVRSLKAYLAGVLRNQGRAARRAERRRGEREERVARGEAAPAADEALERAELARALVDCVLALEEPFRSAVLLRYGEGLSAEECARRLGVPRKTVESRARRGLARLRARWLRGPRAWRSALALLGADPLAHVPRGAPAPAPALPTLATLGAFLMQAKLVVLALCVAGGAGLVWILAARDPASVHPSPPAAAAPAGGVALQPPGELAAPRAGEATPERAALAAQPAEKTAAATQAAPMSARLLRGHVFDAEARPAPGVALIFEGGAGAARAASGADGAFELPAPFGDGEVRADDPALETVVAAQVAGLSASGDDGLVLVVAPHRPLLGRAVDEAGRPLPRARVSFELPPGFLARFDEVLDGMRLRLPKTTTGPDGAFAFERAPLIPGAHLAATLDGYLPGALPAPPAAASGLELVLRLPPTEGALAGRVVDAALAPLEGAWVSLGAAAALTDAAGVFVLPLGDARDATELVALHRGHLPARMSAQRDALSGRALWPPWVELQVGEPPLALSGTVVDERGAPRPGVRLWIDPPTPFGRIGPGVEAGIEYLLGADIDPAGALDAAGWSSVLADEEGRFELKGLLPRDYALKLFDAARLELGAAGPFAAGAGGLTVIFPRGELLPLRGRAVTRRGEPLPGVHLFLSGNCQGGSWIQGASTDTDAQGRFAFEGVANAPLSLLVRGEGVVPDWRFLEPDAPGRELDLVLDLLCHVKVELDDPQSADLFRILDAEGQELDLYEIEGWSVTYRGGVALDAGSSRTVGVAESAATLVLERAGQEVRRLPLRLAPGELTIVTP